MTATTTRRFTVRAFAALIVLAAAGTAAGAPARASVSPNTLGTNPPAPTESVSVSSCHPAAEPSERYVTFSAQMTAGERTRQMSVRFTLLERLANDVRLHPVVVPGFGAWEKSAPGVGVFEANKTVTNLVSPSTVRALVTFRWYDARHHIVMRARRETAPCTMP